VTAAARQRADGTRSQSFARETVEIRLSQLAGHLERTFAPLYVVHGDEPLLAMEAGDAIRAAARRAGFDERELLVAEPGFKWDALLAASANLGLFGARKLVDMRIPSGKPGVEGARALEFCASHPTPDQALLVTLPRLDRATQASGWFAALVDTGVAIAVAPLGRDELPSWIAARLALQKQRVGRETLAFLVQRCEGNLLAARQEIEKLGLLLPEGDLDSETVERAVTDVARYDVFQLSEAWLAGDAARALRIIGALEAEGEGLQLLLWQLSEDLHTLAFVLEAARSGTPLGVAIRNARVWGKRQSAMERAARRLDADAITPLLAALARLDALSKGIGRGSAWDELRTTVLTLTGKRALPLPEMGPEMISLVTRRK
jgi:DNA polymerase III subunit delta